MNDKFSPLEAEEVYKYLTGELDCTEINREADFKLYGFLYTEMPYGTAKGRTSTPDEWYPEYFSGWSDERLKKWIEIRTGK